MILCKENIGCKAKGKTILTEEKHLGSLLWARIEFLDLVRFFYFRCLLIDPHLYKSCPGTAYHHLWLCHITHLAAKNNELPASTAKKLLKSLLEDEILGPYLHIQPKAIPLVQHRQLFHVQKDWDIQKTYIYHFQLHSCPLPFTSPHTAALLFHPKPTFQLSRGCRRGDSHYCHMPGQSQSFLLLPRQAY